MAVPNFRMKFGPHTFKILALFENNNNNTNKKVDDDDLARSDTHSPRCPHQICSQPLGEDRSPARPYKQPAEEEAG